MDQFSNILANEIKPGEEILWQGQPDPKAFLKKGWILPSFFNIARYNFFIENKQWWWLVI